MHLNRRGNRRRHKGVGGARQDSDDWADWLRRHGPALVMFARQWAPSRADAEDLVQEGFVRFWRSREHAGDWPAYLYTCVKRCAIDASRAGRSRANREKHSARDEGQPMLACPLERDERRVLIERALGQLPEAQRQVLVMKVWGGLSFPQIGRVLEIPHDTAASRYRYAIAKLREQLAEEPSHG
jgi:RNA polymerase sigma-70 factor, ECF subfamily